jgi:malate permease and related proteins
MTFNTIEILLPLFLLIAGGFLIARIFSIDEGPLVRAVTDFFMPLLVFHSFCVTRTLPIEILRVLAVVTMVVAGLLILAWWFCRWFRLDFRATAPPILFMNSGFLGIPLMKLWGGTAAMNLIILYDQLQTFYIFTLGIVIVTGSFKLSGLKEMVRTPLIWAIVLGLGINFSGVSLPAPLLKAMVFAGEPAPALAVFTIGLSLNRYRLQLDVPVVIGVALRFIAGFGLGWLSSLALGFSGSAQVVMITASALPAAVFSAVLPLRYGVDGRYASSVMVISTLLSLLTLPLSFALAGQFAG